MGSNVQETIAYYDSITYHTQAERTYDMLLEMIALGNFDENKSYTALSLSHILQIGLTPLRDALNLLKFDSIIDITPRVGISVRDYRLEDYFLQADARKALEEILIRRACVLSNNASRATLKSLNEKFKNHALHGERLELYRVDRAIHNFIDVCAKNEYVVHALKPLRFFEQRVHYMLHRVYPDTGELLNQEHIAYVNAIIENKDDMACKHFKNMIDYTIKLVQLRSGIFYDTGQTNINNSTFEETIKLN